MIRKAGGRFSSKGNNQYVRQIKIDGKWQDLKPGIKNIQVKSMWFEPNDKDPDKTDFFVEDIKGKNTFLKKLIIYELKTRRLSR